MRRQITLTDDELHKDLIKMTGDFALLLFASGAQEAQAWLGIYYRCLSWRNPY